VTRLTVDVDGTSVCVRRIGSPDGMPFVFWHGLGHAGNGSFLDVAAPPLVAAGVTTYGIDAPGYGRSGSIAPDGYASETLVRMLWSVVEGIELEQPILSGHSWGGTIAIGAAARRPADVRALVLFDSGHIDYAELSDARPDATIEELIAELEADPVPETWDELVGLLAEHGLDQPWTLEAWREGFDVAPDGRISRLTSDLALASARRALMSSRASESWPAVAAARIPTLVLLATEPPEQRQMNAEAGERLQAAVPHADVRPIEGMRHAAFPDLGAGAGALIVDWLVENGIAGAA
jgi:pimeloyl-ACP methyl ester carboxylesterase